jgi:hypothetical protein
MRQKRWHFACFAVGAALPVTPTRSARGRIEELTLSWNKHLSQIAVAALIVVSVPAFAHAQRGGGGGGRGAGPHRVVARPVIVAPYYSRSYDPFFWNVYGWGFPGFYAPMFYHRAIVAESSARIQVTPRQTEVYVDGYLAGVVDDFDGFAQRLRVAPGEHVIELYLEGHKTLAQTILFAPGQSYRIRHAMEPLAAGEASPARPKPQRGAQVPAQRGPFDAFGRSTMPGPVSRGSATIAIRVQPGDASVVIDGERWQSSGGDRLDVQVTPGEHRIDVQRDGYQPFTTTIRVGPGDTAPVNVSLTKSGEGFR